MDLLGVYWPIRGEPDLQDMYAGLTAAGVKLALPLITDHQSPLQFAAWTPGQAMVLDRWGIATPVATTLVAPHALLVPCLGFNDERFRLGYGGGYYDRTLAQAPRQTAIGVAHESGRTAFAAQIHDIAMDVIITEAGPV